MAVPTFSSPFLPLVSKLLHQKVSNCSQVTPPSSPETLCEGKADWLGGGEVGEEIGRAGREEGKKVCTHKGQEQKMVLTANEHPIFDYLETEGPLKISDSRLAGKGFTYRSHAVLALPFHLLPPLSSIGDKFVVILPPELTKEDVRTYLNFVYYGNLPESPRHSEEFNTFLWCMKTLRPDMYLKFKVSLGHDREPPEQRDDDRDVDKLLPSTNTTLGEVRFMVDKLLPSTISNPGEVLVDRLLPSIFTSPEEVQVKVDKLPPSTITSPGDVQVDKLFPIITSPGQVQVMVDKLLPSTSLGEVKVMVDKLLPSTITSPVEVQVMVSTACQECSSRDKDAMMLCGKCGQGYHTYCTTTDPPSDVLDIVWFCKICQGQKDDDSEGVVYLADVGAYPVQNYNLKTNLEQDQTSSMKVLNMPSNKYSPVPINQKCDYCDTIIKYKKNINRHMSEFHSNEQYQKYRCVDCNVEFGDQYHLDRHFSSKNCLKKSVEECKHCKKRFISPEKLKVHQDKNCPKKYFCDVCFTFFKTKKIYLNHSH